MLDLTEGKAFSVDELVDVAVDILHEQEIRTRNYTGDLTIDFEIVCKDGSIPANKTFLSASCKYFRDMITALDNDEKKIEFEGSYAAASIMVNYIYGYKQLSDDVIIPFPLLSEVILYTNEELLKNLWDYCYISLVSFHLSVETFLQIWKITKIYTVTAFDKLIGKFALDNFQAIVVGNYLVTFDSHTLESFLLLSDREEDRREIVRAILKWRAADVTLRETEAERLLQKYR